MTASMLSNGRKVPAFGITGGQPGALGINRAVRVAGAVEELGHIGQTRMEASDVFESHTPGGGFGVLDGLGARQGSCRLIYAAIGCITLSECALMTESRSGLRVTGPMGSQLRVLPDHRAGFKSRARRYSAWRAASMA